MRDMILFLFVFIVNSLFPCFATLWWIGLVFALESVVFVAARASACRKARHKCIVKSGNENSFDTSLTVD